ncbi:MAG TPA: GPO family capsid scaffolding protein [Novosphingobium sp.]|nr:GPO family capsid scaffolding protein [Novosphingobium sp.]
MAKSKFFRVFVEGFTASDGRKIEASWIDDIVATFNAETYSPRINIEHIKGYSPEPPFNGYGDVVAVKAQTDELTIGGQTQRRRALYAQVEPNGQLLAMRAKGQKPYPSVEISPDFAGTGKVGLVGLALTDNPASLGTEAFNFSALKPMFDARKTSPANLFSEAFEPVEIDLEDVPSDAATMAEATKSGMLAAFSAFFKPEKPKEEPKPAPAPANDNTFDMGEFATILSDQIAAATKPANEGLTQLRADFATLKAKLESTEQVPPLNFKRSPATGGTGKVATDC